MRKKYKLVAHIPHGSGDAEWQIVRGKTIVAIIDPHMDMKNPGELGEKLVEFLNRRT